MNLKAVLFDFDGTLVKSIETIVSIFEQVLTENALPHIDAEKLRRLIGRPLDEIFQILGIEAEIDPLVERFRKIETARNNATEIALVAETGPTLEFLQSQNLQLGIVSTRLKPQIEKLSRDHAIWKFFDLVVGREDIGKPKPDPEPILFACEKLDISPREILFVGDSLLDLEAAKNANAVFVGVLTGVASREDFKENRADYIFSHIGELSNLVRELN